VEHGGLSAVISRHADEELAPDLPRLLAYKKVIEFFHEAQTVIPMRFACLVEDKTAIAHLLEQRRQPYEGLLKELDGCEEMGIRILPAGTDPGAAPPAEASAFRGDAVQDQPPAGHAYLAARKALYAARDALTDEEAGVAGRVCAQLAGLFSRSKIETSTRLGQRLVSLNLLAPRGSVPALRLAFRRICAGEPAKLLLSGPWPPYNFAQPERAK
jgi:hypothetical protein